MDPAVGFQLHCAVYKINGNGRDKYSFKLPRYWAIIENEIVFDYPKDFDMKAKYGFNQYPWDNDISYLGP